MKLRILYPTILCIFLLVLGATSSYAACSNPAGVAGDQMYNSTHNVMQFCDGTHWTAMKKATETDPQVGAITANRVCRGNGSAIICDRAMPSCTGSTKVLRWNGFNFICGTL